ncbi:Bet1-like SNARE 1-1 [Citrus sinensis]|nr:Bet1-like SNARE 1-1 [Citrus sinensis]
MCRDYRNSKVALFDGIEEGGIRASSSYSHEIDEHDNERALEGLQDRVNLLKRLSGDINEEVDTHNRMLERMGNDMDASRGVLSGTMDKFKMVGGIDDQLYVSMTGVFETKSSRRMFTLVASFVVIFLIVYYLTSWEVCREQLSKACNAVFSALRNSPLVQTINLLLACTNSWLCALLLLAAAVMRILAISG